MTKLGRSNEKAKNQTAMTSKEQITVKQLMKNAGEVVLEFVKGT